MKLLRKIRAIPENMGAVDRSVRMIAGCILIIPLDITMITISSAMMEWLPYALIISLYLLATGMIGWDPMYAALIYLLE